MKRKKQLMTHQEVADKIGWEGGILATLECGIKSSDIEKGPLRDEWKKLELLYKSFGPLIEKIESMVDYY